MNATDTLNTVLAGRYDIEREIGRGGMATVYLARDVRHDRRVALKVLDPELGAILGAERFLSEITVTANLQHPNLLPLFDSGEAGGLLFYVMPYVEGESLRARLARERQLPVDEAVRIAVAIADALDYAHSHGVIHRDLKPENILLQHGQPVVADFGIALAVSNAGGARVTQTGLSLGTPQYMSPEQATGDRAIDGRTDIYSLAAVLYEMLGGEPPHSGSSAQAIIAKLMTSAPAPIRSLRPAVPLHVAMAIEQGLAKLPADRFSSAKRFAEALTNQSFTLSTFSGGVIPTRPPRRGVQLAYAVLVAGLVTVALWGWLRAAPVRQVVRYTLELDSTEALSPLDVGWGRIALSPDGSKMVYAGTNGQLMIRSRDELHAKPIAGTEGASTPFFSPDGNQVGFVTNGTVLKIVGLNGTLPVVVTDSLIGAAGFSWGRDGFIYGDGLGSVPLVRVAAKASAVPVPFAALDRASGETDEVIPDVLPNGKAVLFTATLHARGVQLHYAVEVADVATGAHHVLIDDAMFARYCASGHLLYVTSTGTLMVAPFDLEAQAITGDPRAVAEGIGNGLGSASSVDVALSRSGTLVYVRGGGIRTNRELVWVTRDGNAHPIDGSWHGAFVSPSLSPDGTRLAVELVGVNRSADVWIKQLDAGPATKLTLEGGANTFPTWTPDGRSVFYLSREESTLFLKQADGSTQAVSQLQLPLRDAIVAAHRSPDGKWLVFQKGLGSGGGIFGIRPGVDSVPVSLVATKHAERAPALSPDGRWLAYASNETGRLEVYVVPFPNTSSARWIVSTEGGQEPMWSHRGTELFYRDNAGFLTSVAVKAAPTFSMGAATPLFSAARYLSAFRAVPIPQYAVAADDLFIGSVGAQERTQITVVENWFEELKARK